MQLVKELPRSCHILLHSGWRKTMNTSSDCFKKPFGNRPFLKICNMKLTDSMVREKYILTKLRYWRSTICELCIQFTRVKHIFVLAQPRTDPIILHLGVRWNWVFNFTRWPFSSYYFPCLESVMVVNTRKRHAVVKKISQKRQLFVHGHRTRRSLRLF